MFEIKGRKVTAHWRFSFNLHEEISKEKVKPKGTRWSPPDQTGTRNFFIAHLNSLRQKLLVVFACEHGLHSEVPGRWFGRI